MNKEEIIFASPVPNLNGNDAKSLVEEWHNFNEAIEKVFEQFPCASFHGRNHHFRTPEEQKLKDQLRVEISEKLVGLRDIGNIIQDHLLTEYRKSL
jgi:hypothetical protein